MKLHVGAYAAAAGLDPDAEAELYRGLAAMGIAGLEQPFFGSLHPRDDAWLMSQIRPDWSLVLTPLPGVMQRVQTDKHFGLASADADGRRRALDFVESARRSVGTLHRVLGRRAVRAVFLHSAPRLGDTGAKSSVERFADSLSELRALDWQGAQLLVEHCDAAVASHAPDKGFLRVEDEVLAVKLSSGATPTGLAINWGRSAVETRSAEGPLEHLARAIQAEMLGALFFSGATPQADDYGPWRDSHVPFSTSHPGSLLTPSAAQEALAFAPECPIVGLKLQTKPATLSAAQRLAVIRDGLSACESVRG